LDREIEEKTTKEKKKKKKGLNWKQGRREKEGERDTHTAWEGRQSEAIAAGFLPSRYRQGMLLDL
jgi:hypothetical protein